MNFLSDDFSKSKVYSLMVLITEIVGVALLALMFVIPLFTISGEETVVKVILMQSGQNLTYSVIGIVALVIYLLCLVCVIASVPLFFYKKDKFLRAAKLSVYLCLFVSLIFFVGGYALYAINARKTTVTVSTNAYILFIIMCVPVIFISIFEGLYRIKNPLPETEKEKLSPRRVEPLLFSLLFTCATASTIFIKIISVKFVSSIYSDSYSITGLNLLKDYTKLSSAYQILSFVLIAMYIVAAVLLLFTLTAFFARSKDYRKLAKCSCYVNLIFISLIALTGLYFSIGQKINEENLKSILSFYGVTSWPEYKYKITTQAMYVLIADIVFTIIMLLRKASDVDIQPEINVEKVVVDTPIDEPEKEPDDSPMLLEELPPEPIAPVEEPPAPVDEPIAPAPTVTPEELDFDPCPAFTSLDAKLTEYAGDLAERKGSPLKATNLSTVTKFIVEYAKESKQHLSYTEDDIATFIAGMGASKLAILQGMSGTGKTSLPKIFCEALFGNCEIVEVESSWKDKNELIGYYNEFSRCFTPKKFTQCLYKAALNPEIITLIVLDEMNLSRIEYYFSDFLSLMENEPEDRIIKLLNVNIQRTECGEKYDYVALKEGSSLTVPENVWFVGTANRDESTFEISDKVYDRAQTMNFNKRAPKVRDFNTPLLRQFLSYDSLKNMLTMARNSKVFDSENCAAIKKAEALLAPFNISFGSRIQRQMEDFVNVYCYCFNSSSVKDIAVEKILLSKVVSKLENKIVEDKKSLADAFRNINLNKCAEFIDGLNSD